MPLIPPPPYDECGTNTAANPAPFDADMRRWQTGLLLKVAGIVVPLIIGGAVTVYLQTDRNHQDLMRQSRALDTHEQRIGHEGTRSQLSEMTAELRALRQEIEGGRAVQNARWAEINRRLDALERQRERRGGNRRAASQ